MVAGLRKEELRKTPGIAETLDWAATLAGLGVSDLSAEPEIVHATLLALLEDPRRQGARDARSDRAARGASGMTASQARLASLGQGMRRRLAGFARTLRDAGFSIGRSETSDAARVIASPLADRPEGLRAALKALFASNRSEYERFDELFDAFWRGRGVKRAAAAVTMLGGASRARRFEDGPTGATASGFPERAQAGTPGAQAAEGRGRERGASAQESLARKDFALPRGRVGARRGAGAGRAARSRDARPRDAAGARPPQRPARRPARDTAALGRARRRADRPQVQASGSGSRSASSRCSTRRARWSFTCRRSRASCTRCRRRSRKPKPISSIRGSRMCPRRSRERNHAARPRPAFADGCGASAAARGSAIASRTSTAPMPSACFVRARA